MNKHGWLDGLLCCVLDFVPVIQADVVLVLVLVLVQSYRIKFDGWMCARWDAQYID